MTPEAEFGISRDQAFPFLKRDTIHHMGIVKAPQEDVPRMSPSHAEIMALRQRISFDLKEKNSFFSAGFRKQYEAFNQFSASVFPGQDSSTHYAPREVHGLSLWARNAEEDVFVLQAGEEGTIDLIAGHTCFPSRWNPMERVGQSLFELHGPVPEMGKLPKMIQAFFSRMPLGTLFFRVNWTLSDDPDWYQPRTISKIDERVAQGVSVLDALYYRTEKQHVIRIGEGLWVFLVNVRQIALSQFQDDPILMNRLIAATQNWSDAMKEYKSWDRYSAHLALETGVGV